MDRRRSGSVVDYGRAYAALEGCIATIRYAVANYDGMLSKAEARTLRKAVVSLSGLKELVKARLANQWPNVTDEAFEQVVREQGAVLSERLLNKVQECRGRK